MGRNEQYEREQQLLGILQSYAPTGKEQMICKQFYDDMKAAHEKSKDVQKALAGAIYDGLAYGNWIWLTSYAVS